MIFFIGSKDSQSNHYCLFLFYFGNGSTTTKPQLHAASANSKREHIVPVVDVTMGTVPLNKTVISAKNEFTKLTANTATSATNYTFTKEDQFVWKAREGSKNNPNDMPAACGKPNIIEMKEKASQEKFAEDDQSETSNDRISTDDAQDEMSDDASSEEMHRGNSDGKQTENCEDSFEADENKARDNTRVELSTETDDTVDPIFEINNEIEISTEGSKSKVEANGDTHDQVSSDDEPGAMWDDELSEDHYEGKPSENLDRFPEKAPNTGGRWTALEESACGRATTDAMSADDDQSDVSTEESGSNMQTGTDGSFDIADVYELDSNTSWHSDSVDRQAEVIQKGFRSQKPRGRNEFEHLNETEFDSIGQELKCHCCKNDFPKCEFKKTQLQKGRLRRCSSCARL